VHVDHFLNPHPTTYERSFKFDPFYGNDDGADELHDAENDIPAGFPDEDCDSGHPAPKTATAPTTESPARLSPSSRPFDEEKVHVDHFLSPHPATYERSFRFDPFYGDGDGDDDGDDDDDDELHDAETDMPAGFPYEDWRGIGLLALEYVKGMQGLLLGFMEQDCRWGGARHTI
ncbi:MAG: hypothetical protein Q9196_003681, partial [Gyalolechia fulgens]